MLGHWTRTVVTGFALWGLVLAGAACLPFSEAPSDEPDFQATIAAALQSAEERRRSDADQFISSGPELEANPPKPTGIPPTLPTVVAFIDTPQPSPSLAVTATASPNDAQNHPSNSTQTLPTISPTNESTAQLAADAGEERPPIMFAGKLIDGSSFDLNDAMGTPTLLVFWAPW